MLNLSKIMLPLYLSLKKVCKKNMTLCSLSLPKVKTLQPMRCSEGTFLVRLLSEPDYSNVVSGLG